MQLRSLDFVQFLSKEKIIQLKEILIRLIKSSKSEH